MPKQEFFREIVSSHFLNLIKNFHLAKPDMGASEDFAHALSIAPGAFANIGNGDSAPLHNSAYDFNDEALVHGVRWFVELVRQRLPS